MKKLLSFLAAFSMVATSSATVISCGNSEGGEQSSTKKDLATAVKEKNLGSIKGSNEKPTVDDIVKAINAKNKDLNLTKEDVKFSGEWTIKKAKLQANETSKNFSGSVEVNYEYSVSNAQRTPFDIGLVSQVIDNKDLGKLVRPNSFNEGYLMVSDIKNREKIHNDLDRFIRAVLEKAKGYYDIDADTIMKMIQVEYKDKDGNIISEDNKEITTIRGTIIPGHEDDIDGFHVTGEVNIKIKQYASFKEQYDVTNLGDILFTDVNDKYLIENDLITAFKSKNEKLSSFEQLEIREYDLEKGQAKIGVQINGDYDQNPVSISFNKSNKPEEGKIGKFNLDEFKGVINMPFSQEQEVNAESLSDYLNTVDNAMEFWQSFVSNSGKYFFIGQKSQESEASSAKDGTVDLAQFKKDFAGIADFSVNQENTEITLSFKTTALNKYSGYQISGKTVIEIE
ncbi:hypothetical protein SLITO_v1c01970 [Spiroplasma litorale]|uniref:Lipoprotein n=1 Tax=Spiroplasma litorale TaxID=216942 RepID=A0A0K1W0Z7_9MOLU|nr:lipoprotein [Spiroplasma litorale]AKX33861.1 hypothetical protein SLITO_v1c01970 [Spiroplasma litorale]